MSLFLCPRARPLTIGAAAAVRGATKQMRTSTVLGLSGTASRWISCNAGQSLWSRYSGNTTSRILKPTTAPPRSCRRTLFTHHGIRDYEQLPSDYKDPAGLAFGSKELSEAEAQHIFGPTMKAGPANYLLRVLHGRRIAGTLDDPAYAVNTMRFSDEQMAAALAYLRKTAPVDEVRNAGLRAEDELMQMEEDMAKAETAKAAGDKDDGKAGVVEAPYTEDPVYGHSAFDQIRANNEAKQRARDKAEEAERLEREAQEGIVSGPLAETDQVAGGSRTRAISNPKIQEYYNDAQSDLAEPPQMSAAARILPSVAVVALVVGVLFAVSAVYEEPAARYRMLPSLTTSQATVAALVGLNVLVYMAWKVPPLWKHLNRLFIVSVATPRPAALFASVFSHQALSHLVTNMLPLVVIGLALHDELGRADFLTLFLACGSLAFAGSLTTYTLRGMLGTTTLGASGATLGLCAAYFWEHRMDGFRFFGLPEHGVHGIIFFAALLALQLAGLGKTLARKIDLASHLSGMAAGVAMMEAIRKRKEKEGGDGMEGQRGVIEVWFWLKPWLHKRAEQNEVAMVAALAEAEAEEKAKESKEKK